MLSVVLLFCSSSLHLLSSHWWPFLCKQFGSALCQPTQPASYTSFSFSPSLFDTKVHALHLHCGKIVPPPASHSTAKKRYRGPNPSFLTSLVFFLSCLFILPSQSLYPVCLHMSMCEFYFSLSVSPHSRGLLSWLSSLSFPARFWNHIYPFSYHYFFFLSWIPSSAPIDIEPGKEK
ncbi:hypothetical protein F5H01DRAFT_349112 [Linnemannia elongata]|nr:hypothetical protein F5H01DRAFT_349112 [Linnemannia elongata]